MHDLRTCKHTVALFGMLLTWAVAGRAQVEKVAIFTSGISCGVCAAVSEVNFRRMQGVDKVSISLAKEAVILTYKPGASFDPRGIREILKPLDVQITRLQISARGRVQEESGKRFLIAGKDRFVLAPAANIAAVPLGSAVLVEGIVNDRVDPMEMKILGAWALKQ
jgi:copper chaperone CopZ